MAIIYTSSMLKKKHIAQTAGKNRVGKEDDLHI
jgi:hypothetical protein